MAEGVLNRLYLTIGGLIVAILFAALIVPWFVDWNAWRTAFEHEAEKVLGQPVTVVGSADASLLPMPSVVFTDVRVGGTAERPMMTVARFSAHLELIPLLTGTFKFVDMTIEQPELRITVDAEGRPDWGRRSATAEPVDPDALTLERLDIVDGRIDYEDAQNGAAFSIGSVNAAVEAQSLLGPWKVDGGARIAGVPVTFRLATGRVLDNGSLRVKLDANPASMPIAITADGPIAVGPEGMRWQGDFVLSKLAALADGRSAPRALWRTDGKFELTPGHLRLPSLAYAELDSPRPLSFTGVLSVALGAEPNFEGLLQARQIDLDGSMGKDTGRAAGVAPGVSSLVALMRTIPLPGIPGEIRVDVPGIVIGGSVVQNVGFNARPAAQGWRIRGLDAELPGRTRVSASGLVVTAGPPRFVGVARLSSAQPNLFAAWWRGTAPTEPLVPFDMGGTVDIAAGAVSIKKIDARLDSGTLGGEIDWAAADGGRLGLRLTADRLDLDDARGIVALFGGESLLAGGGAHAVSLDIEAQSVALAGLSLEGVAIKGGFAGGTLTVDQLRVADLAGAGIEGSGAIKDVLGAPAGALKAKIDARSALGAAALVERLFPGSRVARWFSAAAPDLGGATLTAGLEAAPVEGGGTKATVTLAGTAGGTAIDTALHFEGRLADWPEGSAKVEAVLRNPASDALLRQFGVPALPIDAGPAEVSVTLEGVPAKGMEVKAENGRIAGLGFDLGGVLSLEESGWPALSSAPVRLSGADATDLLALLGVSLPGEGGALPVDVAGKASANWSSGSLTLQQASVAGSRVSGVLDLGFLGGRPRIAGRLAIDRAAAGFPLAVALGMPPDPLGDAGVWSAATFGRPAVDAFDLAVDLAVERLDILDNIEIANAAGSLSLSGGDAALTLKSGDFAGGKVKGAMRVANPEGDATAAGHIEIDGAQLSELVWQREGRSVADGTLDLRANFQGTGRSVTALVSTLSGDGSLRIADGVARYVNPEAFGTVMRAADRGQELSEDAIRELFRAHLDAGTLPFRSAEGVFTIAAGTVRAQNIAVDADAAATIGGASVDLNRMTLDSQWTLTVDPGEADKVAGAVPQVDLTFAGPLDAPERRISVAALAGYILVRRQEKLLEEVERLETERIEQGRLGRMVRLYREAAERRAEEAAAAEKARQEEAERQRIEEEARIAREAEAARIAAEEKARAEEEARRKAEADRIAAEKAEAERKAAEAQARAEEEARRKAEADRIAAEKAEADRRARAAEERVAPSSSGAPAAEASPEPDTGFVDRIREAIERADEGPVAREADDAAGPDPDAPQGDAATTGPGPSGQASEPPRGTAPSGSSAPPDPTPAAGSDLPPPVAAAPPPAAPEPDPPPPPRRPARPAVGEPMPLIPQDFRIPQEFPTQP